MRCKHLGDEAGVITVACTEHHGKSDRQVAFKCSVHGRCLPTYRPKGDAADNWFGNESKGIESRYEHALYKLCWGCPDRNDSPAL
jgi:hypothetical protein